MFAQTHDETQAQINKLQSDMNKNKERVNKAMQMMLDGEISPGEHKSVKSRYDNVNTTLLKHRASLDIEQVDYSSKVCSSLNLLRHLDKFYSEASVDVKQKLVGLIFP